MFTTVPAVVAEANTSSKPAFAVDVYAPVARIDTAPFVARAPVVPVVNTASEPDVRPVPDETTRNRTDVVAAVPEMLTTVAPVVTESATTCRRPQLAVDVYAPVAVIDTTPFVATAPVVPVVKRSNEPDVMPVPLSAIIRPTPVVSEPPVMLAIVPAAVVVHATLKNPMLEVDVKLPVPVNEIAPFVAIAPAVLDVARMSEPDVRPVVDTIESVIPVVMAPAVIKTIPVPV